jgi:cell division protein FtsB
MFWLLVIPASVVFAACVLAPVWEDYRAMALAEHLETETVERMRADIERLERQLEGLRNDPAVIARVAQRDLGYHRSNRDIVYVAPYPSAQAYGNAISDTESEPSSLIDAYLNRLPFARHRDAFLDTQTRIRLMCLCGAVVAAAFILYPARRPQDDGVPVN